jgi:hypothetical protein
LWYRGEDRASLWKFFKAQLKHLRIIGFCLYYFYVIAWTLGVRGYTQNDQDKFADTYTEYYTCVLTGGGDSCKLGETVPFAITLIPFTNFVTTGIVLALIFGTTQDNLFFWKRKAEEQSAWVRRTLSLKAGSSARMSMSLGGKSRQKTSKSADSSSVRDTLDEDYADPDTVIP